jgi:hypothetical protein
VVKKEHGAGNVSSVFTGESSSAGAAICSKKSVSFKGDILHLLV